MEIGGFGNHTLLSVDESDLDQFGRFICEDDSIIAVGKTAFYKVRNKLTYAKFSRLMYIGGWAFFGCRYLQAFDYCGAGTLKIGEHAFADCKSLQKFSFHQNVHCYGSVFEGCENLRELYIGGELHCFIPHKVYKALRKESELDGTDADFKLFGKVMMKGCDNLNKIVIGEDAELLSALELSYLPNLKELTILNSKLKKQFWATACEICPEVFRLLPSDLFWTTGFLRRYMENMREPLQERFGPDARKVFNCLVKNKIKFEQNKKRKKKMERRKREKEIIREK